MGPGWGGCAGPRESTPGTAGATQTSGVIIQALCMGLPWFIEKFARVVITSVIALSVHQQPSMLCLMIEVNV